MIWKTIPFREKMIVRIAAITMRNLSTSNSLRKTLYETLKLPNNATQADIKKAYFELSKVYHPDRIEATDENLAKFREISAAYEVLSNEQSRKLYDRGLLGELSKPLSGEAKEVVDPIVNFYKQRQDLSKELLKPVEEIKTWSPPLKKHAKSKVFQKLNYYRKPYEGKDVGRNPMKYSYLMVANFLGAVILLSNLSGTSYRKFMLKIGKLFD